MPSPRTCRTIGPRLTVSTQTVERSTVGTAGFSRESPIVARMTPRTIAEIMMIRFFRFFAATFGPGNVHGRKARREAGRSHDSTISFRFACCHFFVSN